MPAVVRIEIKHGEAIFAFENFKAFVIGSFSFTASQNTQEVLSLPVLKESIYCERHGDQSFSISNYTQFL
jgi:hypothetical protein